MAITHRQSIFMKKLKIVETEEDCGCTVACIATVLGKTYQEVSKEFINDFNSDGLTFEDTMNFLGDNGFQVIHKEIRNYGTVKFGREELLKPFAPIHILRVMPKYDAKFGHVVIMDSEGKVFCPSGFTEEEILDSYAITNIAGFYKS